MKKLLALLMVVVLCVSLCACGSESNTTEPVQNNDTATTPATEEPTKAAATQLNFNEKISLDFVEIVFEESSIKEDIRKTIKNDESGISISRTFGPSPEDGKQFIYLSGKIKNLAKEELPVYDFFLGEFDIDGYKFEVSANECDVYTSNGETETSVPPLTEYEFFMYAGIPNELANNHSAINYTFGFYDMFDNYELSKNRSFEEDPISMCPYQYAITIK